MSASQADVLQDLWCAAAQEAERLRARRLAIEIVEEAVNRLRVAGFQPRLCGAQAGLVLGLDLALWALPAAPAKDSRA